LGGKISNEEVLQRVNETKTMLYTVGNANVWLGHVVKTKSLLHDIIEERMRGKAK